MVLSSIFYMIIWSLCVKVYSQAQQYGQRSESCSLPQSNGYGVCTRFSQCHSAQMAYKNNGIAPLYCSYDRSDPLICCATSEAEISQNINNAENDKMRRRRSEIACQETYLPSISLRIIAGGMNATPGEFPFMAAVGWSGNSSGYDYLCGGSLISESYVLTAAHCRSYQGRSPRVVLLGGVNLDENDPKHPPIGIKRMIVHPKYNRRQVYHDIALIELVQEIWDHKPICLWQNSTIDYARVTIIGYGQTHFEGSKSNYLLKAVIPLFKNEDCSKHYESAYRLENGILDTQLCAGDTNKVKDTCPGDSGGPLLITDTIEYIYIPYILGVTSFGQVCAGGIPGVYTRVSEYLDWIEPIVWPQASK